jgi:hypothetical protein
MLFAEASSAVRQPDKDSDHPRSWAPGRRVGVLLGPFGIKGFNWFKNKRSYRRRARGCPGSGRGTLVRT